MSALFDVKIYVCIFPDNRKIFSASDTAPWPLNDLKEKAEAGTYGVEATVVRECMWLCVTAIFGGLWAAFNLLSAT